MGVDVVRGSTIDALSSYGLAPTSDAAVQIDITAVLRRVGPELVETYLCDHNCTISHRGRPTGGHYNCPASFTLNRGAVAATVPPAELLLVGIDRTLAAAREVQAAFAANGFDAYAEAFGLPGAVRDSLRAALTRGPSEVTLFGGSPEAHPEILDLVGGVRRRGHTLHVTMTGRRIIRSPAFLDELAGSGVDVLALSADDVTEPAALRRLLAADVDELRAEWRQIPAVHGQRQKVVEAIHTARLLADLPADRRPALLFNIAVHRGNLGCIDEVLTALADAFPAASLNPFPAQSAFERRIEPLEREDLRNLRAFVHRAIQEQHHRGRGHRGRWGLVPRMHYWLLLAAALDEPVAAVRVSGWSTWQCFRSAGAGRYVQVAGTGRRSSTQAPAGGRVGCFWNRVLNDDHLPAIWDAPADGIRRYLDLRPVRATDSAQGCPGCLFPRLVGDMVSLECGMDTAVRDAYLALRKHHLAF